MKTIYTIHQFLSHAFIFVFSILFLSVFGRENLWLTEVTSTQMICVVGTAAYSDLEVAKLWLVSNIRKAIWYIMCNVQCEEVFWLKCFFFYIIITIKGK